MERAYFLKTGWSGRTGRELYWESVSILKVGGGR